MSLIIFLFILIMIAVLFVTTGIIKNHKTIFIISIAACILLIGFALFLFFILIPNM